jgi:hypothetical protein
MVEKLINGATVMERSREGKVVLCFREKDFGLEYIVWRVDSVGNTFSGDYFTTIKAALACFEDKARGS